MPRVGGTREEIHRTLVETMRGVLDGRITAKQANRITHAASVQLYLLKVMARLEEHSKMGAASSAPTPKKDSRGRKVGLQWVN